MDGSLSALNGHLLVLLLRMQPLQLLVSLLLVGEHAEIVVPWKLFIPLEIEVCLH